MKNLTKNILNNKTYIVAEISSNHNGSIKLAKKLISDAKISGADCVKFQLFDADKTVINKNLTIKLGNKRVSQIDILKKNQLSLKNIKTLYNFSKKIKIDFAVTATENEHVDFLNKMNREDLIIRCNQKSYPGDIEKWYGDPSKLNSLGFRKQVILEDGLEKTLN